MSQFRDKAHSYITAKEIEEMCVKLGKSITEDYKDRDLFIICVLKGSLLFFADLVREIKLPVKMDFVRLASYGANTTSSGAVRVIKDISHSVEGKHVLIVEDILDTGHTLTFFRKHLEASKPASIKICTLLDKPSRRVVPIQADYCGKLIEDKFVVGYGLDYNEKCRNYKDILYV
jgi:hypoxanthine phosphoribosyltransferase